MTTSLPTGDVRSFLDLDRISSGELRRILDIAAELKKNRAVAKASATSSSETDPDPSSSAPLEIESIRTGCTFRIESIFALISAHCASLGTPIPRESAPCWRKTMLKAFTESCGKPP